MSAPGHTGPMPASWTRVPHIRDLPDAARAADLPADVVARLGRLATAAAHERRPHAAWRSPTGALVLDLATVAVAVADAGDVNVGELVVVRHGDVVLVTESGDADVLGAAAEAATGDPVPALLMAVVTTAAEAETRLADLVADVEGLVFDPDAETPVARVYALKRKVAEARRALAPLAALPEGLTPPPTDPARAADRLAARLDALDAQLSDMLTAHLTLVTVRQNTQTRVISAWAAIIAAPTFVASLYGMNFHHMPELDWPWAYPAVLGLMAALSLGLYGAFRRSGWL